MKNIIVNFLALFIFGIVNNVFAQQKLLFAMENDSKDQQTFSNNNGVEKVILVYQQFFVTNNELDEAKLRKNIERLVPEKQFDGYVILNWEGVGYGALVNNQSDNKPKFQKYLAQFIRSVDIVKEMRPAIKISYFDFPQRRVDKRTRAQWYNFANGLAPLFEKLDFFSPCLYSSYLEVKEGVSNIDRININLSFALEYGAKFKKPVFPFVWHRINPSGSKYRYALIPERQFAKEVGYILNYTHNGEKALGVVWWQSEQYDIDRAVRLNKSNKKINTQYVNGTKTDQLNFFQNYYNSISKFLK